MLTPWLERRFGLQPLTAIALALAAIGLIGRGLAPSGGWLLAATVTIFAGVGIGNVLMPPLVKRYFPDRIGSVTSLYAAILGISAFLPPLVAVPVADSIGWRISLGMWSVFAALAVVPWIALARRSRTTSAPETPSGSLLGRMLRLPLAWALLAAFTTPGAVAYTTFTWLPSILVDAAGVSPATAGVLLSVFAALGLPAGIIIPILASTRTGVPWLFAITIAGGVVGLIGLLTVPAVAPVLWVVLYALPTALFPLVLLLLSQRTRTQDVSLALSGFVQSGGYALVTVFPLLAGVLHDVTGAWTATLVMLLGVVIAAVPAGIVISRGHTIEDDWERRHGAW